MPAGQTRVTRTPTHRLTERRLIDSAASGELADFSSTNPIENDPAGGESWGAERTISAKVIRALATADSAASCASSAGIRIAGARIRGVLNLTDKQLRMPIAFVGCFFERELSLRNATVISVFLGGSVLSGLDARSLRASSDVQLCAGFHARGPVRLDHASIDGNLSFNGASLNSGGSKYALVADDAVIGGHVLMSNGFHAEGEVCVRRMRIGGLFYCAHGRFENPGAIALDADEIAANGDIIMSNSFVADGEVSMRRARLRRDLYCAHGTFRNPGADALSLDGAEIGGRAYLGEWFSAKGSVRMLATRIAGDLNCVGGIFQNAGGDALLADRIEVDGNVRMHTRFLAQGAVRLADAKIGGALNCSGGRFDNSGGAALSAERAAIGRDAILGSGFRACGAVLFTEASIGGALGTEDGVFDEIDISGVATRDR
jgi:hypothetical protein